MSALATPAFAPGPSLARLFAIELRKTVDTRAGFWLLAASVLLAVAAAVLTLAFGAAGEQVFGIFFERTVGTVGVLLPVLGILAVTSEWSQRTAVTTFALVPRRGRVIAAKLLAGLALALASVWVCLVTSLAATALAPVVGQGAGTWDVAVSGLASSVLFMAIWMVAGAALGLLLMSSPAAIVASSLIPIGIAGLANGIPGFEPTARWIDLGTAGGELNATHPAISGQEWAHLAAGVVVWVIVPLALGLLRLRRRDVATS
jgi:ABC-type transport system involved in multi-copper enzyme maturation permease subunit